MRVSCSEGFLNMGRMSSKRMPGAGKSGNCRRDCCSFTLRRGSSVVLGEEELVSLSGCMTIGSASLLLQNGGWKMEDGGKGRLSQVGLEGRVQWQQLQAPVQLQNR